MRSRDVLGYSLALHQKYILLSLLDSNSTSKSSHPVLLRIPYPLPSALLHPVISSTTIPRAGEANHNLWIALDEDVEETVDVEKWELNGGEGLVEGTGEADGIEGSWWNGGKGQGERN